MKQIILVIFLLPVLVKAQPATDIFVFSIEMKKGVPTLSKPINITNRKGYDNQPFFHTSDPVIYYASFNDSGRSDIKYYNYKTNQTNNLTQTTEREYSPTLTPDGKYISCIIQRDNGAQDLGKYPIAGGPAEILVNSLKVGYHSWIDLSSLLLFVLDDSTSNSLRYYNLLTGQDKVILKNPGRSLHPVPDGRAMSFVEKLSKDEWFIRKFDNRTGAITPIAPCLPGREDFCWIDKQTILMSDGTKFFFLNTGDNKGWQPANLDAPGLSLKGITRLAYGKKDNKLAVVVTE